MKANNSQQTIQKPKQRLLYYSSNSQNQTFLIFSGCSEPSAQPIGDFVPCLLATTYLQRKARRIILNMKEVETHLIEKQQCRISVCGVFRPSDVAIKLRKKMNRRVEILEIQEFGGGNEQEDPSPNVDG